MDFDTIDTDRAAEGPLLGTEPRCPAPVARSQALYVAPLTQGAAALVPELLPSGLELRFVPESRFASEVIYDLARAYAILRAANNDCKLTSPAPALGGRSRYRLSWC
jgi:hypothetical protein